MGREDRDAEFDTRRSKFKKHQRSCTVVTLVIQWPIRDAECSIKQQRDTRGHKTQHRSGDHGNIFIHTSCLINYIKRSPQLSHLLVATTVAVTIAVFNNTVVHQPYAQ